MSTERPMGGRVLLQYGNIHDVRSAALHRFSQQLRHGDRDRQWRRYRYIVPTADTMRVITDALIDSGLRLLPVETVQTWTGFVRDLAQERSRRMGRRELSEPLRLLLLQLLLERYRPQLRHLHPPSFSGPFDGGAVSDGREPRRSPSSPGMIKHLAELFASLQKEAAVDRLRSRGPEGDLSLLFAAYERALEHLGFFDAASVAVLAREALMDDTAAATTDADGSERAFRWDHLVLDGFERFTYTERKLLVVLAKHARRVVILKHHIEDRANVFVPLDSYLLPLEPDRVEYIAPAAVSNCSGVSRQLFAPTPPRSTPEDRGGRVVRTDLDDGKTAAPDHAGSSEIFTTQESADPTPPPTRYSVLVPEDARPGRLMELETIAAAIQDLLADGVPADMIAVTYPQMWSVVPILQAVFGAHRIPYSIKLERKLSASSLVDGIITLLTIPLNRYRRDSVMNVFGNPYLTFGSFAPERDGPYTDVADHEGGARSRSQSQSQSPLYLDCERYSRLAGVYEGRSSWARKLERLERLGSRSRSEKSAPDAAARIASLAALLDRLFTALGAIDTARSFERAHERLVALLEAVVDERCLVAEPGPRYEYEMRAWSEFRSLLERMTPLLTELEENSFGSAGNGNTRRTAGRRFVSYLRMLVSQTTFRVRPREGAIQILGNREAALNPVPYLFFGGLVEGEFPRPPKLHIFLSDRRRVELGLRGRDEYESGERYLFHAIATSPRRRLVCSKPIGSEARPILGSTFLHELRRTLSSQLDELTPDPAIRSTVALQRALGRMLSQPAERIDALTQWREDLDPTFLPHDARTALSRWSDVTELPQWRGPAASIRNALGALRARYFRSVLPIATEYNGRLPAGIIPGTKRSRAHNEKHRENDTHTVEDQPQATRPERPEGPPPGTLEWYAGARAQPHIHRFAITHLEAYGQCPYRYFLERVIALEPLRSELDELRVELRGALIHEILFRFQIALREGTHHAPEELTPGTLDAAMVTMRDIAKETLSRVPANLGRSILHRQLLGDQSVPGILRLVLELESTSPTQPQYFELPVGEQKSGTTGRAKRLCDPTAAPLSAIDIGPAPDGNGRLEAVGTIDRVDTYHREGFVVNDYKSGTYLSSIDDIRKGFNLQLPLYASALLQAAEASEQFQTLTPEALALNYIQVHDLTRVGYVPLLFLDEHRSYLKAAGYGRKRKARVNRDEFLGLLQQCRALAGAYARGILAGDYLLTQQHYPGKDVCHLRKLCPYWHICRFASDHCVERTRPGCSSEDGTAPDKNEVGGVAPPSSTDALPGTLSWSSVVDGRKKDNGGEQ